MKFNKVWNYGNVWEYFPVNRGEIWSAGPHKMMCADLELDDISPLFSESKASLAYTDPPWNQGNAKAFQTKNYTPRVVDFHSLLEKIIGFLKLYVTSDIAMEMGNRHTPDILDMIKEQGGEIIQSSEIWYGKRTNRLIRFYFHNSQQPKVIDIPSTYRDEKIVREVLRETMIKKGEVVFDCCTGLGMTARVAEKLGLVFYGTELNPRRLAHVLQFFSKRGYKVERVM